MNKNSKIFVAGHTGLVGSSIFRLLQKRGYKNIITKSHKDLPLDDFTKTNKFFYKYKPEYVFLSAAKVGGILANSRYRADFIKQNLFIQLNVIEAAYKHGVNKLLFLGSSCIYPKYAKQPIKEEYFMSGKLEETNSSYAIAKIAGKELCDSYNHQYGFKAFTVMPCNVYGINDNFHVQNSHVIAALMRRFHEAKIKNLKKVSIWGSGKPLREFINSYDLARACIFLMKNYKDNQMINVGTSKEISIKNLAHIIARVVQYKGALNFDKSKPDGTPRKVMDNTKITKFGWKPIISLEEGLKEMYEDFKKKYKTS